MREVRPSDERLLWNAPCGLSAHPGGFAPARFPPEIFEAMRAAKPGAITRMECPTGCSLHLRTDARRVRLEIEIIDTPRDWGEFAVLSDGEIIGSWQKSDIPIGAHEVDLELAGMGGLRDVEIVLPHILDILIKRIEVDGRLEMPAVSPPDAVWLAIGDSLTQGMNALSPLSTYVRIVEDRLGVGAWNLGIGGQTMDPAPFEWAFTRRPWRAVTAALGTNDWFSGVPLETFRAKTSAMMDAAAKGAPEAAFLIVTPPPAGREPSEPAAPLAAYREALVEAAAEFEGECSVIDGTTLVSPEKGHFTPDGLHLSPRGFAAYADGLIANDRFHEAITG